VLADRVEPDVLSGRAQHVRIVLELAQPAVAVEAEESTHLAGHMVVIHVYSGRDPADGTQATLGGQQRIRFLSGDAVPTSKVIGPLAANEVFGATAPGVVARLAVRRATCLRRGIAPKGAEWQDFAAIRAPFVPFGHNDIARVPLQRSPGTKIAAFLVTAPRVVTAVKRVAISGIAILGKFGERTILAAVAAVFRIHCRELRN
jgi:hypothetical protein